MASSRFRGPEIHTVNYQPGVSALKIIQEALRRNGDHVSLIEGDTDKRVTSSELLEQSSRIAAGLQLAGVSPGDLVVLCCNKSIVAYSLLLGAMFTGATVIVTPAPHADSIDRLTSGQVLKALFYDSEVGESVSQSVSRMSAAPPLLGKADTSDPILASLLKSNQRFIMYRVEDVTKHVPFVFFSSGTTGHPKGIEISDLHVQLSGLCFSHELESLLLASPLYWYSALCTLVGSICKTYPLILTNSNDARHRLQLMEKYKVESFFSNIANMIQYINEPMFDDFDLSSVKQVLVDVNSEEELLGMITEAATTTREKMSHKVTVRAMRKRARACIRENGGHFENKIIGGEIVLPSVARPFFTKVLKGRVRMAVLFGSTEAGVVSNYVVTDEESMQRYALGACGKLVPGLEIKILDDNGGPVEPGVMGKIWIKSLATKGYWRREDLNRSFLDSEGFYDSGDAGCFDSEGNLYLRGRICDLINFRGIKISPAILEDLLMAHPAIKDAVVVGRPQPSDGQHPTAFVVLRPQYPGTIAETDIRTYVDEQVEDSLRLRGGVHFRESLPRVYNGKVIRKLV